MELIGGLSFLGNFLNNRDNKKELDTNQSNIKVQPKIPRNEQNIYDSQYSDGASDYRKNKATKRFRDSKSPKPSVIPKFYNNVVDVNKNKKNNDSEFSDEYDDQSFSNEDVCSDSGIIDKCDRLVDNRKHERKIVEKFKDSDNYLNQFNELKFDNKGNPVSVNAVSDGNAIRRMETERELSLSGGYSNFAEYSDNTYGLTSKEHFTHNNMKPFFKSKGMANQNGQSRDRVYDRNLELFTGSSKQQDWRQKKEQTPLFSPLVGVTNIFGTPDMTDFYESRYIPGKERRNEKLMQPVKVTPGLGLSANGIGQYSKGSGDPYRIMFRDTDEIRTANKPKLSYEAVHISGQLGARGPVEANPIKYRAPRFKENDDADRMANGADVGAPGIYGEINPDVLGTNNRGLLDRVQYGTAGSTVDLAAPNSLRAKYRVAFKENFLQAEPRNIQLIEGLDARPNEKSYQPSITNREDQTNYIGPVGINQVGNTKVVDYNDITRSTIRQSQNQYDREGRAIVGNMGQSRATDYSDTTKATIRQSQNQYDREGKAIVANMGQSRATDYSDTAKATIRQSQNQYDREGKAIVGNMMESRATDYSDTTKATIRQSQNQYDREGKAIIPNMGQTRATDYSDVVRATIRQSQNQYDREGKAIVANMGQIKAVDYSDTTKATIRQSQNQYDREGKAIALNMGQIKAVDYSDTTKATIRQSQNQYDREGKAIAPNMGQIKAVDYSDTTKATIRQSQNQYDREGKAIASNMGQTRATDYNDVVRATIRQSQNQYDREGKAIVGNMMEARATDYSDTTKATIRQSQNQYDREGKAIVGNMMEARATDYSDTTKATIRQSQNQYDREGKAIVANMGQTRAVDYSDTTKATIRQSQNQYDREGKAIIGNMMEGKATDYNDVTKATIRQSQNKYDREGKAITGNIIQGKTINYNDVTKLTIREQQQYSDVGQMHGVDQGENYVINYELSVPNQTQREITGQTNRIGPSGYNIEQTKSRLASDNQLLSTNRANVGRTFVPANYQKGPSTDLTAYRLSVEKLEPNREIYPNGMISTVDKIPFEMSNNHVPRIYKNDRISDYPELSLQGNPYINNIIHQSIITYN